MASISRSPSYLIHAPYSYCFRIAVPKDVQPYIDKTEIRWSLRTGSLKDAKHQARALGYEFQRLFRNIRGLVAMQDLTNAEMREIVNRYIRNLHDRFETVRVRSMPTDQKKRLSIGMERFTSGIPDMFKAELIDWDNANVESCVDQALADHRSSDRCWPR